MLCIQLAQGEIQWRILVNKEYHLLGYNAM
jgi:hypothetical protein